MPFSNSPRDPGPTKKSNGSSEPGITNVTRVQSVSGQSLLNGSEGDITSARVHKPQANFHRTKGNLTTGKVKEKLHHTFLRGGVQHTGQEHQEKKV